MVTDNGIDQSKDTIEYKKASEAGSLWTNAAVTILLIIILFGGLFFFIIRSAQGQKPGVFSISRLCRIRTGLPAAFPEPILRTTGGS